MFTKQDKAQMLQHGIDQRLVEQQIAHFVQGFPFLNIDRAATLGDGILSLGADRADALARQYDRIMAKGVSVVKFVPASGAATRMFKELFEFLEQGTMNPTVENILANIQKFAFYEDLKALNINFDDPKAVIDGIISGLDYGRKPKGLLKFHRYAEGARTAMEEHLVEGAMYGLSCGKPVDIHFTVSPEHLKPFEQRVKECKPFFENKFGVTYNITYSQQKNATDTIAVDMQNEPLRNNDGTLLFRPAGHGALLGNLDELKADLLFIKTVDNVVPDHLKSDTIKYKKAIAALAIELREKIFDYIRAIDNGTANPEEVITFVEQNLGCRLGKATNFDHLRTVLNRPLRVCGMVRNQGEPGGGPFWVLGADGTSSLQIAESSQIAPAQKELIKQATHFNPVDLVCSVGDYRGKKFDLKQYIDPSTGFISVKSKDGRALKAQELPGLWNGAMANWNTVFVEVPITTFAPVKTIIDLLRKEHQ